MEAMKVQRLGTWSAQEVFLYFSQGGARDRLHLYEAARDFERGKLVAAAAFEGFGVEGGVGDDEGYRDLAAHVVRDADDGGFGDAGLFEQELFDLARIDVEATGDDEIGL